MVPNRKKGITRVYLCSPFSQHKGDEDGCDAAKRHRFLFRVELGDHPSDFLIHTWVGACGKVAKGFDSMKPNFQSKLIRAFVIVIILYTT